MSVYGGREVALTDHDPTFCREQDFENYVAIKDYSNAIRLALAMEQPKRLLRLLTEVRTVSPEIGPMSARSSSYLTIACPVNPQSSSSRPRLM